MFDSERANKSAKAKSEAGCDDVSPACPPPPPCPDGCSKVPKITAKEVSYTVVLDRSGNVGARYPILTFEISDGCPNHYIDIQVARKNAGLLTGGPGIPNSWNKAKLPKDRVPISTFSSWTTGETSLKLDGTGKATFAMPLDWWRDFARIARHQFSSIDVHFKVLAFCDPATAPISSAIASVPIKNNLTDFKVIDNGYIEGGITKSIKMQFTVLEPSTTDMYTFVQWMQGSFKRYAIPSGVLSYPPHKLYNILHIANFPDKTIDRLRLDPRYWDGAYTISTDFKTASATDGPNQGNLSAGYKAFFSSIDFETRLHLNFDVPPAVTITRQEGSAPLFGIISGKIADPVPLVLDSATWKTRVLQIRNAAGAITVTHPASFRLS